MKHPLTSKERRGLVAVAAAALLCIGSGFVFRSCSSHAPAGGGVVVVDGEATPADSAKSGISDKPANGRRARREKRKHASKKKAEKTYPTRSPLDEPCD